eukprot:364405-Chlamydomonas_euryale.AAC.1
MSKTGYNLKDVTSPCSKVALSCMTCSATSTWRTTACMGHAAVFQSVCAAQGVGAAPAVFPHPTASLPVRIRTAPAMRHGSSA